MRHSRFFSDEIVGFNVAASHAIVDGKPVVDPSIWRAPRTLNPTATFAALIREPRPDGRRLYGVSDVAEFTRTVAAGLRAAVARYPGSPEVTGLVDELLAGSDEFAALWESGEVDAPTILRKIFQHPVVGAVTLNCDVLDVPDRDQHVVIYTADPGSSSEEALRLLSVVGTQRMDVSG